MPARPEGSNGRPARTASQRGRGARIKGRQFTADVRRAWEATIGQVIPPMQEVDADDLVDAVNGLSIECKNQRAMNLAGWVDQAARQGASRGLIPLVVHKRVGTTDAGRWYVTLEFRHFAELVLRLKRVHR